MAAAGLPAVGATAVLGGLSAFNAGLTSIGAQFGRVGNAAAGIAPQFQQATAGFQAFNQGLAPIAASLNAVTTAFHTVGAAVSVATAPIRAAVSALGDLMEEVGSRSVQALRGMIDAAAALGTGGVVGLAAFGAAITTAFGASLAAAARFQREVIDVAAITQESPAAVGALTEAVKDLARQFATSIPDIQSAGLELARAGIPMADITSAGLKLTLALEQLSKGEISAGAAAESLGSIFQTFREEFKRTGTETPQALERIANAITAIGNETRASIPEVVSAFNKMGIAFANTKQPVEDAAAAVGILLQAGLRGEEAGTALSNFFLRLQAPARESQQILERFGVTTIDAATGSMLPFGVILGDLIDKFGPYQRSIRAITEEEADWALGEIFQTRVLRATTLAVVQGTEQYERLREAIRQTDIFAQAAQQMDALLRQLARFRNVVELASIAFGTEFVTGLSAATRQMNDFLVTGTRLERLATALGTGVRGVLSGQGAVGGPEQEAVRGQFGPEAAQSFSTITEQTQRAFGAIGELIGAIGRLKDTLIGVAFPTGIDDLVIRLTNTFIQATQGVQSFVEFLGRIAQIGANAFGTAVQGVLTFLGAIRDTITVGLTASDVADTFNRLGELARIAATEATALGLAVARFVRSVIDNRDIIIGFTGAVIQGFSLILRTIVNATTGLLNFLGVAARVADFAGRVARNQPTGSGDDRGRGAQRIGGKSALIGGVDLQESADPSVTAGIQQQIAALEAWGRQMEENASSVGTFNAAVGDGTSGLEQLIETFRTGKTEAQRQVESLEKLQGVMARGNLSELGGFLGDPLIPKEIKDSIAEIIQILPTVDDVSGGWERLAEIFEFLGAQAGVVKEEVRRASAINGDAGGDPRTRFDFTASERERKKATSDLARAQDRIAEAREDAVKNISAAERQLANASAGIVQRYADTLESINEQHRDALKKINQEEIETLARLDREFNKTQTRQTEDITRGRSDEDARRLFDQGLEDARGLREQAATDAETIAARSASRVEQVERRHQEDLTRIRQQGIDNTNTQFARAQEDALSSLTRANEQAVEALTRQFDATNLGRGRDREDARRIRDRDRALTKASTPEQRTDILARFSEESTLLKERRKEEDEERQIRAQQELALQALRRSQEVQVLQFRRGQEDAATVRRREQETSDIDFRRGLEEQFLSFKEGLDNEAIARRRTAEQLALADRRADELAGQGFGRGQQDALRAEVTLPRAQADQAEQVAEAERRAEERREEAREAAARRLASAERTTNRELESAVRTFLERMTSINDRIEDQRTDAIRGTREQAEELARLIEIAPENERAKLQAVLDQVNGLGGSYRGLKAEIEAAGLIEAGFSQARIDEIRTRLGLRQEETRSIEDLLGEFRSLQGGAAGAGAIEIRALVQAPQADRMIELLERLVQNTARAHGIGRGGDGSGPLVNIEEINVTEEGAGEEIGRSVVDALQLGGVI